MRFTNEIDVINIVDGVNVFVSQQLVGSVNVKYAFEKSPEYIALHQDRAQTARIRNATLALTDVFVNALDEIPTAVRSVLTSIRLATENLASDRTAMVVATIVGILSGPVIATLAGGSAAVGLAVSSTIALLSAYYSVTESAETRLANDPPDSNYTELYSYSTPTLGLDFGLGSEFDEFFNSGFLAMARVFEAQEGELLSLERAQGALLAGDDAAAAAQFLAAESYASDYLLFSPRLGDWFFSIQPFMTSHGYGNDTSFENFYELTNSTARDLQSTTAVSEPGALWLFVLSLAGLVVIRLNIGRGRSYSK